MICSLSHDLGHTTYIIPDGDIIEGLGMGLKDGIEERVQEAHRRKTGSQPLLIEQCYNGSDLMKKVRVSACIGGSDRKKEKYECHKKEAS